MATNKHELAEHVRLIIQEMQAENAANVARTAAALSMMKRIEDGETTVVLPRPCNGPLYDKCTLHDHVDKVVEECDEMLEAYCGLRFDRQQSVDRFLLECTDVITAVTSLMESIGCNERMRQAYQRRVNHSNAVRDGGQRIRRDAK